MRRDYEIKVELGVKQVHRSYDHNILPIKDCYCPLLKRMQMTCTAWVVTAMLKGKKIEILSKT